MGGMESDPFADNVYLNRGITWEAIWYFNGQITLRQRAFTRAGAMRKINKRREKLINEHIKSARGEDNNLPSHHRDNNTLYN